MKIWLFNPYGQIPGEGWRDYRFTMLGKALSARGHTVIWWTANFSHTFKSFREKSWADIPVANGFQIRLVPTSAYRKNIGIGRVGFEINFARAAYRKARTSAKPDFIVATDPSQIVGYLGVRLARKFRVPLVLDVFDLWPELFALALPRFLRFFATPLFAPLYFLRRHNIRRADGLISLCQIYLAVASRDIAAKRVIPARTIYNGIDIAEFRLCSPTRLEVEQLAAEMGKRAGDFWAVYTGTLGEQYDVETMLKASLTLRARAVRIKILVLGEGPLRSTVSEFIAAHADANITYLGKSMKPDDLLKLYRVCDVGLCAYSKDSNVAMPNKAADYLAAGLPIINSLKGELQAFIDENGVGLAYVAGVPESLADVLCRLAEDSDLRARMAGQAFEKAEQFDSKRLYKEYAEFIEKIGGTAVETEIRVSVAQ